MGFKKQRAMVPHNLCSAPFTSLCLSPVLSPCEPSKLLLNLQDPAQSSGKTSLNHHRQAPSRAPAPWALLRHFTEHYKWRLHVGLSLEVGIIFVHLSIFSTFISSNQCLLSVCLHPSPQLKTKIKQFSSDPICTPIPTTGDVQPYPNALRLTYLNHPHLFL